jgi:hypothetical protein
MTGISKAYGESAIDALEQKIMLPFGVRLILGPYLPVRCQLPIKWKKRESYISVP